jgi:tetratricopeptide (TPR) repeat protein
VILWDGSVVRGRLEGPLDGPVLKVVVRRGDDEATVEVPAAKVRRIRRLAADEERLVVRAEESLLAGDHARAVAVLEALVRLRPKDPRAHRELGFALLLAERPHDAVGPLQKAVEIDAIDVEAHLLLARALESSKKLGPAIDAYRQATRVGPKHVRAWRALARLLLERATQEDRREALDAFRRASKEDPADEAVALEWAQALLEQDPAQARAVLEGFVKRQPKAVRAGRALAQLEAVQGKHAAAVERLDALLAEPGLPPDLRERLAAEVSLYAWLASGAKAPAPPGTDAAELFPAALPAAERTLVLQLELLPEDGRLHLALARVLLRANRIEDARGVLERAALAGPAAVAEDALVLQEAAGVLLGAARIAGVPAPRVLLGEGASEPRARRLVALVPWAEAAHVTLAEVLVRAGDFAGAAKAYRAGAGAVADAAARMRLTALADQAEAEAERKRRNAGT